MNRCPTTHGHLRCEHEAGHQGNCEYTPPARPWPWGPYRDWERGRAYLRGAIDVSVGATLGTVGGLFGVHRRAGEDDCAYRDRIWRAVSA